MFTKIIFSLKNEIIVFIALVNICQGVKYIGLVLLRFLLHLSQNIFSFNSILSPNIRPTKIISSVLF